MKTHPQTRRDLLVAAGSLACGAAQAQPARTRVRLQTDKGVIVVELADDKAPITVANFLRYVDTRSGELIVDRMRLIAHPVRG